MTASEDNKAQEEAERWFARQLEPSMPEHERAAFERWRSGDPRRGEAYAATERLWDELGSLKTMPDMRRSEQESSAIAPSWRRLWRNSVVRHGVPVALAASLVAAVVIVGIRFNRESDSPVAPQVLSTALGEQRTVRLEDGTMLKLNTQSRVEVRMGRRGREITLSSGEAAFDVAHEAARPFVVVAGDGTVTALGTRFDVRNLAGVVAITLMEGQVRVARASRETEHLIPGQQATYSRNARGIAIHNVDVAALTSWMSGRLEFRGTPLRDVVAEANRYSRKSIRIADDSIDGLLVSGTFRAGDTDHIVAAFEAALPVRATDNGREVVLLGGAK